MTIHSEHPFLPDPGDRSQVRRLRAHLPAPVSVWTSADGTRQDGLTVSSMLVADGDPAEIVALINEDADWWDLYRQTGRATVNILARRQHLVSEVFARLAPSPGGVFRTGEWAPHPGGPRLVGAAGWAEVSLIDTDPLHAGWGLLVRSRIISVELASGITPLLHQAGHYA